MWTLSVDRWLRLFFFNYGFLAYKARFLLLAGPVLLTLAALPAIATRFNSQLITQPEETFASAGGLHNQARPSHLINEITKANFLKEKEEFVKRWPFDNDKFVPSMFWLPKRFLDVVVFANDGGNVLRFIDDIAAVDAAIAHHHAVTAFHPEFNQVPGWGCLSTSSDELSSGSDVQCELWGPSGQVRGLAL